MIRTYHRGVGGWDGPSKKADGDYVLEEIDKESQTALRKIGPYRVFRVSTDDAQVANDGTDTETVTVDVVDGLEVARGTDFADAAVLDVDDDATLLVDGVGQTVTITAGTGSIDVTTTTSAGSSIEIVAESLASAPADSDTAEIEVVSA